MTGGSPQDPGEDPAARPPLGADFFTAPDQVNHRRYEALRAFFIDGLTHAQAAAQFGYTRWAMVNLVREYRAGHLDMFAAPRKPGPPPGVTPAKDRARKRVVATPPRRPVHLRDLRPTVRRRHPTEPHQRR